MRNLGLFAFAVTTCVLVPAAAHYLTAGRDQVTAFVAPKSSSVVLGKAKIEARLEHPLVDPGGKLSIKLAASSATGKSLAVGVLVYGASGDEGARVSSPPVAIAHQTVTIPIDAAGNGSKEIAIRLTGARDNRWSPQMFTSYQVLVMSPKAADKLAGLRSGARLIGNQMEGIPTYNKAGARFMSAYGQWSPPEGDDAKLFAEGTIARLDAYTRTINKAIAIEAPTKAPVGNAFIVAVTVKNTTGKAQTGLQVSLDAPTGLADSENGGDVMPSKVGLSFAKGESKRLEFRVTPKRTGVLGLYATVRCDDCKADALTRMGTFDAVEIQQVERAPIVGSK